MKTQISKDGFRADRRYSGVYQQQGRLITDSDWNEMVDIMKARLDDALADVIGNGTPKGRPSGIQIVANVPKIKSGVVYANGVEAQVVAAPGVSADPFGFNEQADFPAPPSLPPANTAYRLYADVWERAVVSLEDGELRDPALHGADTCTRTQTMAQVKWCPQNKDPENAADNPAKGNSTLTVAFAQGGNAGLDPCDPQTSEVDPVGGDFLLRVEVHDVHWPNNAAANAPDRVVIKWSRENGAEQYPFEEMPDWFKTGPWLYELYNATAEKHLGYHLAGGFAPTRGDLKATLPQSAPAPNTLVRRWDGYAVAVFSGSWGPSNNANDDPATTAPGADVKVTGGNLTAKLGDLDITLALQGKILLPGDAWLIPVRRAVYAAGKKLLDNGQPAGIRHRYVTLAEVQANGTLKAFTSAEQRRFAFPRLTDISAADIGFPKPCNTSVYQGATVQTVADALGLLCNVKAEHVAYGNAQSPAVKEVKAGLDDLYTRVGKTGNRFLVGPGGYPTIQAALQDLAGKTNDIALALAPGDHSIPFGFNPGNLSGKHLSILGVGGGSRVLAEVSVSFPNLASFTLDNVSMQLISTAQLIIGSPETVITNCRIGGSQTFGGLILPKGEGRFRFHGNWVDVPWNTTDNSLIGIIGTPGTLGNLDDIEDAFSVSFDFFGPRSFSLGQKIVALSLAQRQQIQTNILNALSQIPVSPEEVGVYKNLAVQIGANSPSAVSIALPLQAVRTVVHRKNPATAILLSDLMNSVIEDNRIIGIVGLYGEPDPLSGNLIGLEQNMVTAAQNNKLHVPFMEKNVVIHQNEITGILCGKARVDAIRTAVNNNAFANFTGFQRLTVTNNSFERTDNQFHAMNVNLASNYFRRSTIGWTLCEVGTYVGNSAPSPSDLWSGVLASSMQAVGNVRINVK